MKRIIKDKQYNTKTATKVGSWDNGYFLTDINYCSENLYCKKNGEYFLIADGKLDSQYKSICPEKELDKNPKIIPLTDLEAQDWIRKRLLHETKENASSVQVCIDMNSSDLELIKKNAARAGMSMSSFIVYKCTE